jgi:beta-galactosidase
MGNSNGNFQEYYDIIGSSKHMQGGFIWDWVDQGMLTKTADGRCFFAYGGDLGGYNLQNDENFCANGLVAADRKIHPGLYEVKKVYSNIKFLAKDVSKGLITISNQFDFTNLDEYAFKWELIRNGEMANKGDFNVSLAPHQQQDITLAVPSYKSAEGTEFFLNVYAVTKNATELIPAGHEVAREQFKFAGDYFAKNNNPASALEIKKEGNRLSFSSGDVNGVFDLENGRLVNYRIKNDKRVIEEFPQPYFWRAPTDNDFGNHMPEQLGIWRNAHENRKVVSVVAGEPSDTGVSIKVNYNLAGISAPYAIEYLIQKDGAIRITSSIDMTGRDLPELPRFGMRMQLPMSYNNVSYYGRGPWENYSDRNTSSFIGSYHDTVTNQFTSNYIRPQESGYHTDVRWVSVMANDGNGILIEGLQPVCFSATNNLTEDLDPGLTKKQQHPMDIRPRNNVYLHIDLNQRGVGGDNSWGQLPHDPYRMLAKKYSYSYIIRLIQKK